MFTKGEGGDLKHATLYFSVLTLKTLLYFSSITPIPYGNFVYTSPAAAFEET